MGEETVDNAVSAPPGSDTPPEPLTMETALAWLAAARPGGVLALLRKPDFAFSSVRVFAGFRVNAQSYGLPVVRQRLAREAVQNSALADKLRALGEEAAAMPAPESVKQPAAPSPPAMPSVPASPDREQALRAERDRLRQERDKAREELARARQTLPVLETEKRHLEAERDELIRQVERQGRRIVRLERQALRLQAERDGLRHAQPPAPVPAASPAGASEASLPEETGARAADSPWQAAITHLLDKGKADVALTLADDVLRGDPDEPGALDIAARALQMRGETRAAAAALRRLLSARAVRGETPAAGDALLRLLLLLPPPEAEKEVRLVLGRLQPGDAPVIAHFRAILTRLRGLAPATHSWLATLIGTAMPRALAAALMPAPGALGRDDPLPLEMPIDGRRPSAHRILTAVARGEDGLVKEARDAFVRLRQTDPGAYGRAWGALERAAGEDEFWLAPLQKPGRGPVVVDASNVAWLDQESLAAGRARLRPLREVRRALYGYGFFPVLLFGDAALPFQIDEPDALRAMLSGGEIWLVDGGVDADEVVLREARRLEAPLVTNDRMVDWDPEGQVEKIRFVLPPGGGIQLLFTK